MVFLFGGGFTELLLPILLLFCVFYSGDVVDMQKFKSEIMLMLDHEGLCHTVIVLRISTVLLSLQISVKLVLLMGMQFLFFVFSEVSFSSWSTTFVVCTSVRVGSPLYCCLQLVTFGFVLGVYMYFWLIALGVIFVFTPIS